ncbi:MAG: hypothetical protein ACK4GT_05375 [Pararhodobacter sp.]
MLRMQWRALPELIRFMIGHFVNGVVLGWAFGLTLIWMDIGGIGTLLGQSNSALLTAFFFVQGGLLFGSLATSVAVMNLRDDG